MDVIKSDKHSSFLQYFINLDIEKFHSLHNKIFLVSKLVLEFAGSSLSVISTQVWYLPAGSAGHNRCGSAHNYYTRIEVTNSDKHSSFLKYFIN